MENALKLLCPACGEVLSIPVRNVEVTIQENGYIYVEVKAHKANHKCEKVGYNA